MSLILSWQVPCDELVVPKDMFMIWYQCWFLPTSLLFPWQVLCNELVPKDMFITYLHLVFTFIFTWLFIFTFCYVMNLYRRTCLSHTTNACLLLISLAFPWQVPCNELVPKDMFINGSNACLLPTFFFFSWQVPWWTCTEGHVHDMAPMHVFCWRL